jgi:hypothetical protein
MRIDRSFLLRYGGAVVVVLLAMLLRWELTPWLGSRSPVSLFVLAVLVSAQYGGLGPRPGTAVATGSRGPRNERGDPGTS